MPLDIESTVTEARRLLGTVSAAYIIYKKISPDGPTVTGLKKAAKETCVIVKGLAENLKDEIDTWA